MRFELHCQPGSVDDCEPNRLVVAQETVGGQKAELASLVDTASSLRVVRCIIVIDEH